MDRKQEFLKMKEEYQEITPRKGDREKMEEIIQRARRDKEKRKRNRVLRNWGLAVAAALALIILPNTNANIAHAMEKIPVLGGFFRVVTVRKYEYSDSHNKADVEVPKILTEDAENTDRTDSSEAARTVNRSAEEYIDRLVGTFQKDMVKEGYSGLDVSHQTVTDTDIWFTLKITAVETKASGYEFSRYYNIDKTADSVVSLKDLFADDADYNTALTEEIRRQMQEQMDADDGVIYWLEDDEYTEGFHAVKENQNFYFNEDGDLVIVFDEYEVAPGSMGCPEFVIPAEVTEPLMAQS